MNRRGAGIGLLGIAAILYIGRYISAAIIGSGMNVWAGHFEDALHVVGQAPLYWSMAAAVLGIIYLVMAEVEHSLGSQTSHRHTPQNTTAEKRN